MIPSGTLKYKLIFKQIKESQTGSGFITKSKEVLFTCRASKTNAINKYAEDAKEMFKSSILEFKVRYNKLINNDLLVEYNNTEYRIIGVDENRFDHSLILTIEKINN